MANIPRVKVGNQVYNIKDAEARNIINDLKISLKMLDFSSFDKKQYIDVTNSPVNITPQTSSSGYKYVITECTEEDVFVINGSGGGNSKLWTFTDSSYNIIAQSSSYVTQENHILIPPKDAAYLIINTSTDLESFRYSDSIEKDPINVVTDDIWKQGNVGTGTSGTYSDNTACRTDRIDITKGTVLSITTGLNETAVVVFDDYSSKSVYRNNINNTINLEINNNGAVYIIVKTKDGSNLSPESVKARIGIAFDSEKFYGLISENIVNTKNTNKRINAVLKNYLLDFSSFDDRQYIDVTNSPVNITPQTGSSGYKYVITECTEEDVFVINGSGGGNSKLWTFTDSSYNIIAQCSSYVTQEDFILIPPKDAAYLIINTSTDLESYKGNVSNLFSIDKLIKKYDASGWEQGTVVRVDGRARFNTDKTRCRFGPIPMLKLSKIYLTIGKDEAADIILDNGKTYSLVHANLRNSGYYQLSENGLIYITVRRTDNSEIDPESVVTQIAGAYVLIDTIKAFNESVHKMHRDVPENQGVRNAYRKAHQFLDIVWTNLLTVPVAPSSGRSPTGLLPGKQRGLIYSSVKEFDKFIGFNVSIKTFMTAVHNRYSMLYTENTSIDNSQSGYGKTYIGVNCGAYFGIVCNILVLYALGMKIPWNTSEFEYLSRIGVFEKPYDQSGTGVKLMDILWEHGHAGLISDIYRDDRGVPTHICMIDSVYDTPIYREIPLDSFNEEMHQKGQIIYRYKDLYKNLDYAPSEFVAVEDETIDQEYQYNDDICTFAGDYASFNSTEDIYINYTAGSYNAMEIYKNDVYLTTLPINTNGHSVKISPLEYGRYKARLTNGIVTSGWTYFEVIETDVTGSYNEGTAVIDFSSSNGTPVYLQITYKDGTALGMVPLTEEDIENESVTFDPLEVYISQHLETPQTEFAGTVYAKVFFDGEYGRVSNYRLRLID